MAFFRAIPNRIRLYWPLIKSLQTGLLLSTGLAGYMSGRCPVIYWQTLVALAGSLALSISGSTVLNMVYDRDIDAMMNRTARRPLPVGLIRPGEALALGLALSGIGVGWALLLSPLYGALVFAGLFFDVVIYTMWLKRRTPYSILIGGLSGGMPALAGRTLAIGHVDWLGILLALAVLFWIPTHIMTFSITHDSDYRRAHIPTFPLKYGVSMTRAIVALCSVIAAGAMGAVALGIGMSWGYIRLLAVLSAGLLLLAIVSIIRPSERLNYGLFKYASLYMLSTMVLLALEGL
jgi:protoheme IX farnesyltransferase